jgi:acetolactate synthase-1/2/3 large subunit
MPSGGLGTMGFGLPAALGAAVGLGTTNVWAVVGDGGFQMTQAELATAVQERVPFNIAIMNNGFLGMVRQWQELFFEERYNATPISGPDFVMLAKAHGIPARRVTRREEVIPAIEWANSVTDGPVLLDFVVEQLDIVYPMVPAGASLHEMIRRPIPDKKSV